MRTSKTGRKPLRPRSTCFGTRVSASPLVCGMRRARNTWRRLKLAGAAVMDQIRSADDVRDRVALC